LIDYDLTIDMSPYEIVEQCGVSIDAAKYQYKKMHEKKSA
jgi:hypothetical protein